MIEKTSGKEAKVLIAPEKIDMLVCTLLAILKKGGVKFEMLGNQTTQELIKSLNTKGTKYKNCDLSGKQNTYPKLLINNDGKNTNKEFPQNDVLEKIFSRYLKQLLQGNIPSKQLGKYPSFFLSRLNPEERNKYWALQEIIKNPKTSKKEKNIARKKRDNFLKNILKHQGGNDIVPGDIFPNMVKAKKYNHLRKTINDILHTNFGREYLQITDDFTTKVKQHGEKYIYRIKESFVEHMRQRLIGEKEQNSQKEVILDAQEVKEVRHKTLQGASRLLMIFGTNITATNFGSILKNTYVKNQSFWNVVNDNIQALSQYPELLSLYRYHIKKGVEPFIYQEGGEVDINTDVIEESIQNHIAQGLGKYAKLFREWYLSPDMSLKNLQLLQQKFQMIAEHITVLRTKNIAFTNISGGEFGSKKLYQKTWDYFQETIKKHLGVKKDTDHEVKQNFQTDLYESFHDFLLGCARNSGFDETTFQKEIRQKRTLDTQTEKYQNQKEYTEIVEKSLEEVSYDEWMGAGFDNMEDYAFTTILQENDEGKFILNQNFPGVEEDGFENFITWYQKTHQKSLLNTRDKNVFSSLLKKLQEGVNIEEFLTQDIESLHILLARWTEYLYQKSIKERSEKNDNQTPKPKRKKYTIMDVLMEKLSGQKFKKLNIFPGKLANKIEKFDDRVEIVDKGYQKGFIKSNDERFSFENQDFASMTEFFHPGEDDLVHIREYSRLRTKKDKNENEDEEQNIMDTWHVFNKLSKGFSLSDNEVKSNQELIDKLKEFGYRDGENNIKSKNKDAKDFVLNKKRILSTKIYLKHAMQICNDLLVGKGIERKGKFAKKLIALGLLERKGRRGPYFLNLQNTENSNTVEHLIEFLKFALFNTDGLSTAWDNAVHGRNTLLKLFDNDDFRKKCNLQKEEVKFGPYKNFYRALDKSMKKYNGAFAEVKDMTRMNIVKKTQGEMLDTIEKFIKYVNDVKNPEGKKYITSISFEDLANNIYALMSGKGTGYREIRATLQLADGNTVEVQFSFQEYADIKKEEKAGGKPIPYGEISSLVEKYGISFDNSENQRLWDIYEKIPGNNNQPKQTQGTQKDSKKNNKKNKKAQGNKGQFFSLERLIYADLTYNLARELDKEKDQELIEKLEKIERILFNRANGLLILEQLRKKQIIKS